MNIALEFNMFKTEISFSWIVDLFRTNSQLTSAVLTFFVRRNVRSVLFFGLRDNSTTIQDRSIWIKDWFVGLKLQYAAKFDSA